MEEIITFIWSRNPKERIFWSRFRIITLFIFTVIAIIANTGKFLSSGRCTAQTMGTVINVVETRTGGARRFQTTEYTPLVRPADGSVFSDKELFSNERVSHHYRIGDVVKIFYEPGNISNYYIQYARPGDIARIMTIALLIDLVIDGTILFFAKRDRKREELHMNSFNY